MGILKTITLSILFLLLTAAVSLSAALFSLEVLYYPDVYEKALEAGKVYTYLADQVGQQGFKISGPGTESEIKSTVNKLLGNLLSYVRSDTDTPDLKIDTGIAGKVDLLDVYDPDRNVEKARFVVDILEKAKYASVVLVFVLIGLMAVVSKSQAKDLSKKIGMALVTTGVLNIVLTYAGKFGTVELASRQLATLQFPISLTPIIAGIVNPLFDKIIFYNGMILAIGIAVVAVSILLKENKN